jgi:hypothetical protein
VSEHPAWLLGARTAPSAHNTQPWRFRQLRRGRVEVGWDPRRALPAADPTSRDLFLALGAAVEAARVRSAIEGKRLAFTPVESDDPTVGYLEPENDPPSEDDVLLAPFLDVRQTARTPHLPRPVPAAVLNGLSEEAERGGRRLRILGDRRAVRHLARLARRATAAQLADPAVHAELWRWLRLDPRDPSYRRDGLTAECLELRGAALAAARLALHPAGMRGLVRLRLHHLLALDAEGLTRVSAALCLLTTPSMTRAALLDTGRVLLRLWLIAARAGLSTHPMSALLDCVETIGPTAATFGERAETAAALFRLGATSPVARAHRLPAEELIQESGAVHAHD